MQLQAAYGTIVIMAQSEEIAGRLKWALFLRVILVTFLVGATFLVQVSDISDTSTFLTIPLVSLYILAGATYVFTIISGIFVTVLKKHLTALAYAQVFWESMFVTGLIYITGGQNSLFTFLYLLSIVTSAILLYRPGAFVSASLSSIFYGALLFMTFYGKIKPLSLHGRGASKTGLDDVIYNVSINTAGFFAVAILASYLAAKLRRTGEELERKVTDFGELEAINESIVQSIDAGIITTDRFGTITSFNASAEHITGLGAEPVMGLKLNDVLPEVEKCGGGSQTYYNSQDRGELCLGIGKSVLKGPYGSEIGQLIVLNDLTQMKAMEEKLKISDRLAAVGELASGLAHEIRNPLASISGSVQLMGKDKGLAGSEAGLMRIVLREAKRLNELITKFLNYARPSPSSAEEFGIKDLIEGVVASFKNSPELPENLEVQIEVTSEIKMLTDRNLVEQILWNLLVNASQAMPDSSGGKITISAESISGNNLRFLISDTGKGIEPENMGKIFTPFFTTKEGGAGLGLATVYRVVEALGGSISVNSIPGEGTSFTIELPTELSGLMKDEGSSTQKEAYG